MVIYSTFWSDLLKAIAVQPLQETTGPHLKEATYTDGVMTRRKRFGGEPWSRCPCGCSLTHSTFPNKLKLLRPRSDLDLGLFFYDQVDDGWFVLIGVHMKGGIQGFPSRILRSSEMISYLFQEPRPTERWRDWGGFVTSVCSKGILAKVEQTHEIRAG